MLVRLQDVVRRSDESKTLTHKLKVNGVSENMTGWTVELYLAGSLAKAITQASAPETAGRIKDQTASPGEYFFTLLAQDLALHKGRSVQAYVRYVTPEVSPPRVFSNVEFTLRVL
jgi:hypothetical protein